ncbi:MAG: undecaprenyldiphospho-muramoylpentapeptide beta-N-acetylglucosaminyltransferase [Succinivibrio sp.]|nr:undecaprenyldiphospho-muramoylpentapeptide beta-N-acetylglucosaminyltransferase [Succinivibrio sp.]
MKIKKILIMAGGTGGHVFPALAIAGACREQGCEVLWLGSRGRMEEQLVPKYGYPIRYIEVSGIRRNGLGRLLKAPLMISKAVAQALEVEREFKPDVVLGMGGYASGPGGVAAKILGIPLAIHEQNAKAGLTNKLLSKLASRVLLGFAGAFVGPKVEVVGNPVRPEIVALREQPRDFGGESLRILIVGGSLGAQALNELVPKALMKFEGQIEVVHQCGKGHLEKTQAQYEGAAFRVEVREFIDDMVRAYSEAQLIICRAGALTVAEVSCAKLPAIFIPLPTAVDDHQTKNAESLVREGAALMFKQSELSADELYAKLQQLSTERGELMKMSGQMERCAITNATQRVVEVLENMV